MDNPQTWNRYSYVLNNPLELTDPTGEEWNLGNGSDQPQATWTDQCGVADDCIKTIAIADTSTQSVTVYGDSGATDVTTYEANGHGVIDVQDVAANPNSQFEVAPQQHPEDYLSPNATAALFNAASSYHESNPDDDKLAMTGGSASNGQPAKDANGKPLHSAHHGGNNIDLRYMGKNGQQLTGSSAAANGDPVRNKEILDAMKAGGFKGSITGNAAKYGSKHVSPALTKIHQTHIHIQQN